MRLRQPRDETVLVIDYRIFDPESDGKSKLDHVGEMLQHVPAKLDDGAPFEDKKVLGRPQGRSPLFEAGCQRRRPLALSEYALPRSNATRSWPKNENR